MIKKFVVVRGKNGVYMRYIKYGTIGWLKTTNGDVRQCRCVGTKWKISNSSIATPIYEWEVAGIDTHCIGTASRLFQNDNKVKGIIYTDFESAKLGKSYESLIEQYNEMRANDEFYIVSDLVHRYGAEGLVTLQQSCYGYHYIQLSTYGINKDKSVCLYDTDFEVLLDKNGIRTYVPLLEGKVDGKRRYASKKAAYAAIEPIKVYTFDEEEPTKTDDDTLCVTIKIKSCDLNKISDIAEFLEYINRE